MYQLQMRPAQPEEAGPLSALALRSKAYWGYDETFMAQCREELTLHPHELEPDRMGVAVADATPIGFYSLIGNPPTGEVGHLFVDPPWIGRGIGRRLWDDMVTTARALGFTAVMISSDPSAAPFYTAMGGQWVGSIASGSIVGRELPLFRYEIASEEPRTGLS
jgi:GNAT superfamily N-acetyltransferase